MKSLLRLVLMTSSLLIVGILAHEQDDDESSDNLEKLKRATMRRNAKPQKVPKFGWGKRGVNEMEEIMYPKDDFQAAEKKEGYYPEYRTIRDHPWNVGSRVQSWNGNNKHTSQPSKKCDFYGCRVQRSGWDSHYGKRGGLRSEQNGPNENQHQGFAADKNGWGSGYGRNSEKDKLAALTRARRRSDLTEDDVTEDDSDVTKRQANRNGWNSAYGRRRR